MYYGSAKDFFIFISNFPLNVSVHHWKGEYDARSENRLVCYSQWYVTLCPFNDAKYHLTTMLVTKGCCAHEALRHTFNINISMFRSSKIGSAQ